MEPRPAADIARDALRALAQRKLAPTPGNYEAAWREISGEPAGAPSAASAFADALASLHVVDAVARKDCSRHVHEGDWEGAARALAEGLERRVASRAGSPAPPAAPPDPKGARWAELSVAARELGAQIALLVDGAMPALGVDDAKLAAEGRALSEFLRGSPEGADLGAMRARISQFNLRLAYVAEDQRQSRNSMLSMLRTVFSNLGEMAADDRWLREQSAILLERAAPPLAPARLEDARARLEDIAAKQRELNARSRSAQAEMKTLLAQFLERLSAMSATSSSAQLAMEACAKRVESAKGAAEIAPALADAISSIRLAADGARASREEIEALRARAQRADSELQEARRELEAQALLARRDLLTGALNRQGLSEAFEREASRAARAGAPLSIAFLDLDHFKALNDKHGHLAGDAALALISTVARESLRPQDCWARFGGEEFVLLMPDTDLDGGAAAVTRLQRELTRRFFMAGHDQLLITFSAGVAQLAPGEDPMAALDRADRAMLKAKQAGRNKVFRA